MITISFRPVIMRIILLLVLAAGFGALGWVAVRAAIGESIMIFIERSQRLSTEAKIEAADLSVKFAKDDPLVHWQRGGVYFNAANEESEEKRLDVALDELRRAALMNPEDYRMWLSFGRVLDRAGSIGDARAALEKALQLAPNHFETHWTMGNHLLRAGDRDASFAQMRLALSNRPSALPLIFDYAWSVFGGDGKAIAKALDPPLRVKAQMIALIISRGKVEDGLSLWREMDSPTVKDVQKVVESLITVGKFAAAYDIWSSANIPDRPSPDANSLLANGGFEQKLAFNSTTPFFAWRITPAGIMRVTLDQKEPSEGNHSLRYSFDLEGNLPLTLATQTVPVKRNKKYCLSFFVKTEELESLSTPLVEVFDAADLNRAHAMTAPVRTRNNKWTEYEIAIDTAAATEALTVRLQRPPCSEPPCPISGRVWFDGFKLNECAGARKLEKRETHADPMLSKSPAPNSNF